MLILGRKAGDAILIGDGIRIVVLACDRKGVRLGIDAPSDVTILREEIVTDGAVPYPPGTRELHHEVELVVALGRDAPARELGRDETRALVFGYAVGLDLTRRDLQSEAKAKSLPWDIGKAFDASAPISEIVPIADIDDLQSRALVLQVNGERRQHGLLSDLIWNVDDILHELSKLYRLRAGDLVFMGTPAGVGPLQVGDEFAATLEGIVALRGRIAPPLAG